MLAKMTWQITLERFLGSQAKSLQTTYPLWLSTNSAAPFLRTQLKHDPAPSCSLSRSFINTSPPTPTPPYGTRDANGASRSRFSLICSILTKNKVKENSFLLNNFAQKYRFILGSILALRKHFFEPDGSWYLCVWC